MSCLKRVVLSVCAHSPQMLPWCCILRPEHARPEQRGLHEPVVVEQIEVLHHEAGTCEARTCETRTCEAGINQWWVVTVFQAAVVAIPTAHSIAVLPSVVVCIFVVPSRRGLLAAGLRGHRSHRSFLSFRLEGKGVSCSASRSCRLAIPCLSKYFVREPVLAT